MGKVFSIASKPFREFNIESRAHKVISKGKPTPAPKYKSDELDYERILKEYPSVFQESLKKDDKLDKHLKDVYVMSENPSLKPPPESSSASRPLPIDRSNAGDAEFGFREPKKVPYGRVTLRTALDFIGKHQSNPTEYTVSFIANEFKLPKETTKNILKYFRVYEVYIPTTDEKGDTNFVGPAMPRKHIVVHEKERLTAGDDKGNSKS